MKEQAFYKTINSVVEELNANCCSAIIFIHDYPNLTQTTVYPFKEVFMKVIIKRPGEDGKIAEVEGLPEINKICGNVDSAGNGVNRTSSAIRIEIDSDDLPF